MPRAVILAAAFSSGVAIDPMFATNITVYHINQLKYGPKPISMDSGDAAGDMFFDFHNGYIYPLQCPDGAASGHSCANPEVVAPDLMVNKVILEVDSRYSGYARCNVGINGTASGMPCEDDTYCCACADPGVPGGHGPLVPCNATLGCENILESHGGRGCSNTSEPWQCYKNNVAEKFTPDIPGYWYSSLAEGYCDGSEDYYTSSCTWRVVSIPKVVTKQCHADSFLGVVGDENRDCFDACGIDAKNTSSVCWAECFYETVLGPDAGRGGGAVAGMELERLLKAWLAPFESEDVAQGGCPNMAGQTTTSTSEATTSVTSPTTVTTSSMTTATTTTTTTTTTLPGYTKDILIGVLKGLLLETDDAANCQTDIMSAAPMVEALVADIKAGNFAAAIGDLSTAFGTIQPLVTDCEPVGSDAQNLLEALKKLSPKMAEANLKAHSADIFEELSQASRRMSADDYDAVGVHLGTALRKVIVGDHLVV